MKNKNPVLSICIPAYGRIDFVINTLKSIYSKENLSAVSLSDFEVVISDNDLNMSLEFLKKEFEYPNFHYYNTICEGFLNSYHVLTYAKGEFLKLHNSQEILKRGALSELITIASDNKYLKPSIFFTSGYLKTGKISIYDSFDDYMCHLSYWSSWSNGFCIWKDDFDKIKEDVKLNSFFPHTSVFLTQHSKQQFIINDQRLFTTQFVSKRGGHNKFHAFCVEYPSLIDLTCEQRLISIQTKSKIFKDILFEYLPLLFFNVKIAKREKFSSIGFKNELNIYFPKGSYSLVVMLSFIMPFKVLWRKLIVKYLIRSEF